MPLPLARVIEFAVRETYAYTGQPLCSFLPSTSGIRSEGGGDSTLLNRKTNKAAPMC